ncbi:MULTISPECIES: DUF4752 family protein [Proteus]|uniref:DUF4752 family protein n=1 Tax=Proteus TaxID=583 RepID=UPI000DFF6BA3|nr:MULTISPECIES: DUF4752 family protein [Proteus]MCX2590066.1 DUF4752 family protein [Proteus penneri]MDF7227645.1 DUF4752 family protein [Proteus mirabilis]SUB99933.1 Uncharacterised protein [Proteus penneri]
MSDETYKWIVGTLSMMGYVYIVTQAFCWFVSLIFRKLFKRKSKERKKAAIAEFYEAYELDKINESQMVRVTTKHGLVIVIYREPKGDDE